jgi:hypothetical protein
MVHHQLVEWFDSLIRRERRERLRGSHEKPLKSSLYIRIIYTHPIDPANWNPGKMTFTTASGVLPAGIAVYVQREPNGVLLETRYLIGL